MTKNIWEDRFEDIPNIERYLTRNGVVIRNKHFLTYIYYLAFISH
jgi:polyphosphate kinase 2 (PPK2 family)